METTDQTLHVDSSADMGPLLMHEDESPGLPTSEQHSLLSDVQLPSDGSLISPEVDKCGVVESVQDQSFKFHDGQPVTLEDGTAAYVHSTYKAGSQPVVFEDGTTMYISHEHPAHNPSIDNSSLGILNDLHPITEAEDKRLGAAVSLPSSGQKLYKCETEGCKKVYTTHHHLQYHRKSHLERKPFVCGYSGCNKTFSTSYGLKSHIRVHTGEKPYKCTHCPKAFKTSGDLQKHIRIHTGEKPFKCPFQGCDRSFTTSNIRKVHIRTHTGEKPYVCDECGKRFSSCTNHRNHIRIHSGERPYVCQFEGCDKRFTEYSSLYKHNVVHSASKPYACPQCGKLYRQASTLAMHKRTAHGESELVLTGGDVMTGQLITLEQTKGTVLSTGVVGVINSQNKQFTTKRVPSASLATSIGRTRLEDQIDLSQIDPDNLVIVTHPCFKIVQSEGNSRSEGMSTQMVYTDCITDQGNVVSKISRPGVTEVSSVTTQGLDLAPSDIIADTVS